MLPLRVAVGRCRTAVRHCRTCRTVGLSDLSDCRTTVGSYCRTVGPGLKRPLPSRENTLALSALVHGVLCAGKTLDTGVPAKGWHWSSTGHWSASLRLALVWHLTLSARSGVVTGHQSANRKRNTPGPSSALCATWVGRSHSRCLSRTTVAVSHSDSIYTTTTELHLCGTRSCLFSGEGSPGP